MSKVFFPVLTVLVSLSGSVGAKTTYSHAQDVVARAPFDKGLAIANVSEDESRLLMKNSESRRKPANSVMVNSGKMSPELRALQAELFTLKTSEEMDAFLTKLDAGYDAAPADVKFYATQVLPLKAFRGIFYRMRVLFQSKSDFAHSQVISAAKQMANDSRVFFPAEHSQAAFQYIASPYYKGAVQVAGFQKEADFKVWMTTELLPLLNQSAERLEKMNLTQPVVWDQRMVYGAESFSDDIGRFKLVGEFEKNIALSGTYGSISNLAMARAYSSENIIQLYREVGFVNGLDGFGPFDANGVSTEKIVKVLKQKKFSQTFTLLPDGKEWMQYSYKASLKSINKASLAWELSSQGRKDEDYYVFDNRYLDLDRDEATENLTMVKRIMTAKGPESLRSGVTGEVIQIDYAKFYMEPVQDMKTFLPVSFESGSQMTRSVKLANGQTKSIAYRNYHEGSAKEFNISAFEKYFPNVNSSEDVRKTMRVLSHVQGNWLALR